MTESKITSTIKIYMFAWMWIYCDPKLQCPDQIIDSINSTTKVDMHESTWIYNNLKLQCPEQTLKVVP